MLAIDVEAKLKLVNLLLLLVEKVLNRNVLLVDCKLEPGDTMWGIIFVFTYQPTPHPSNFLPFVCCVPSCLCLGKYSGC